MATLHDVSGGAIPIWGGLECTVNRVGNVYFDQLKLANYQTPFLDSIAQLGIKTLRFPILWERTAPDSPTKMDWAWADENLGHLQQLGIRPIVGLVHHGSGPHYTSLLDADFAKKLADFALAVAERYPWIDAYIPVNEPLTTARFSGLYGHWYPHHRDDASFAAMLMNECRATVLAMQAIRTVSPAAELIQTEDFGRTFATPLLAYQAHFENERRFLPFDLLCGKLNPDSLLWGYLTQQGEIAPDALDWFNQHTCPPNVIGINYYLTSDRYLDESVWHYPESTHGGNGLHCYADVESVRTPVGLSGYFSLLSTLWQRYKLPLAVTETHLGSTREEQVRWLSQCVAVAGQLKHSGVDMRAVTAWSLFGAFDWDCLVTRQNGCYEPGVFDLRAPTPRPTALAHWIKTYNHPPAVAHPVLSIPGWWHRPEGQLYPQGNPIEFNVLHNDALCKTVQPLLITGGTGTLGQAMARLCQARGIPYLLTNRALLDITDSMNINAVLTEWNPWAVVNTAGYVRVDEAENEPERCYRDNTDGPRLLAEACAAHTCQLVTFSTDLVFDGRLDRPYIETDAVDPLNVYGDSKAQSEQYVLDALPTALIIRSSAFFGPWDQYNLVTQSLQALASGHSVTLTNDGKMSPTYVPHLVNAVLDLLLDGETGLWHLSNDGAVSWAAFITLVAERAGITTDRLVTRPLCDLPVSYPQNSALQSCRGQIMPTLSTAIDHYLSHCDYLMAAVTQPLVYSV